MNKIILKVIILFFVLSLIFTVFSNNVLANTTTEGAKSIDGIIEDGDNFLDKGGSDPLDEQSLIDFSNSIYNLLLVIGTILAVVVGSILGIKFMISTIDEKAKIKQMLIPYVVGCVVLFGAFGIWKIVINLLATI